MRRAALTIVPYLLTLSVLAAVPGDFDAAPPTGGIRVRVLDENLLGFPGVMVTLSHPEGDAVAASVLTDTIGSASFPALP